MVVEQAHTDHKEHGQFWFKVSSCIPDVSLHFIAQKLHSAHFSSIASLQVRRGSLDPAAGEPFRVDTLLRTMVHTAFAMSSWVEAREGAAHLHWRQTPKLAEDQHHSRHEAWPEACVELHNAFTLMGGPGKRLKQHPEDLQHGA